MNNDHLSARRHFLKAGAACLVAGVGLRLTPAQARQSPFRLVAGHGATSFIAEQKTPTRVLQYNQSIPGPVIRLPQGRESVILFENAIDEASSVHWHGLRIDNAMDGVPGMTQAPVQPGETFEYRGWQGC